MSVEAVGNDLRQISNTLGCAPFMNLTSEQLDRLSLDDILQTMQQLLGVVCQRQEEDIPVVAALIPPTRSVLRDNIEYIGRVAPLEADSPNPVIEGVQAALQGTDRAMGTAGEHVLTMAYSTQQAIGQITLAIGHIEHYEGARRQLLDSITDVYAGRDQAVAGVREYQQNI